MASSASSAAAAIPKELQSMLSRLQALQRSHSKLAASRQTLDAQLSETKMVQQELSLAKDDQVFKLVGPALVPQDTDEARATVEKRLMYIEGELKRQEKLIAESEEQQESIRTQLTKMSDLLEIYARLFDHRSFLRGEAQQFVRDFETKRSDDDVEALFKTLQQVTELREGEVEKLCALCDSTTPLLNDNLGLALDMSSKILDTTRREEIEQALESSRETRAKEWASFARDVEEKKRRIEEAFAQKEKDTRQQFEQLQRKLEEN